MTIPATQHSPGGGWWRLPHADLAALLRRRDLSWESARVLLALADLTLGFGKDRDEVSLSQIANVAGMGRPHVARALATLRKLGLVGQVPGKGQSVVRWAVWPPPLAVADSGTAAKAIATSGNSTVAGAGSRTVAKAAAGAGTHQDTKKRKKDNKNSKKGAAGKPPPDSRVKVFLGFFCSEYKATRGQEYIVSGGKDGALVKRLLKALDGQAICGLFGLKKAARYMLDDGWASDKASVGLLASQINTWRGNGQHGSQSKGRYVKASSDTDYNAAATNFGGQQDGPK